MVDEQRVNYIDFEALALWYVVLVYEMGDAGPSQEYLIKI